jgi:hypothetical protein
MTVLYNRINAPAIGRNMRLAGTYKLSPRAEYIAVTDFSATNAAGEVLNITEIPANSTVTIKPDVTVSPQLCRVHIVVNNKLSQYGIVSSFQDVLEPGDESPSITMRTNKAADLSQLEWIFRMYLELK